jgi:hypothetical protein
MRPKKVDLPDNHYSLYVKRTYYRSRAKIYNCKLNTDEDSPYNGTWFNKDQTQELIDNYIRLKKQYPNDIWTIKKVNKGWIYVLDTNCFLRRYDKTNYIDKALTTSRNAELKDINALLSNELGIFYKKSDEDEFKLFQSDDFNGIFKFSDYGEVMIHIKKLQQECDDIIKICLRSGPKDEWVDFKHMS